MHDADFVNEGAAIVEKCRSGDIDYKTASTDLAHLINFASLSASEYFGPHLKPRDEAMSIVRAACEKFKAGDCSRKEMEIEYAHAVHLMNQNGLEFKHKLPQYRAKKKKDAA